MIKQLQNSSFVRSARTFIALCFVCLMAIGSVWGQSQNLELTFDLTSNPGSWPTTNSTTLTDYTYTLDGTSYTFALSNVKCNNGYLMLTQPAVLGLPAMEGYKLTKVVAKNSSGCSTSVNVGVSSSGSSASYISGGGAQKWSTQSSSYTYTLNETSVNTVYYLYVTTKNAQIVELALTYEPVFDTPIVVAPAISPASGTYTSAQEITISADAGTIHYTTDGANPTDTSTEYTGPFNVNTTTTVKAIAVDNGVSSSVASATYTFPATYTVQFSINGTIDAANNKTNMMQLTQNDCPAVTNIAPWTFAGWSTNADASCGETISLPYSVESNVTLYAVYLQEGEDEWQKITSLTDITAGEYVIVNDGYALPNVTASSSPAKNDNYKVIKNGEFDVDGIIDHVVWNFTISENKVFVKNSEGKYLYANSSNAGLRVGTTSDSWTFEENNGGYAMKETTNSRFCATYVDGSDWRSYTTKNHENYGDEGVLYLYKKISSQVCTTSVAPPTLYEVTASENVSLTGTVNEYYAGQTVEFYVSIPTGYFISTISIAKDNGGSVDVEANPTQENYSFEMPEDNVSISVTFELRASAQFVNGIYEENLTSESSFNRFYSYNVSGDQIWQYNTQYHCAYVSGYANSMNNANEDWLISRKMDVQNGKLSISFETNHNYANGQLTVKYSTNYEGTGNPYADGVVWNTLSFSEPDAGAYVMTELEPIVSTDGIYVAFVYTSTDAEAAFYDMKNFVAKQHYQVLYNANGGSGEMLDDSSPYKVGSSVQISGNEFTAPNTTPYFLNWNTQQDGSGTVYAPNETLEMGSSNVTLYAQWVESVSYNIVLLESIGGNISVEDDAESAEVGTLISLSAAPNDYYELVSWNVLDVQGQPIQVNDNSFFMPESDVRVSATFQLINYEVSFDAGSGTYSGTSLSGNHTDGVTLPNDVAPCDFANASGYTFVGWSTQSVAETETVPSIYNPGFNFKPTENITFYAVYARNTGNVAITDAQNVVPGDYVIAFHYVNTEDGPVDIWYYLPHVGEVNKNPEANAMTVDNNLPSSNADTWSLIPVYDNETLTGYHIQYTDNNITYFLKAANTAQGISVSQYSDNGQWTFVNSNGTGNTSINEFGATYSDAGIRYLSVFKGNQSTWRYYSTKNDYKGHLTLFGVKKIYTSTPSCNVELEILANDDVMGAVTGSGEYVYGATATLMATANAGYRFAYWSDGSTDAIHEVTAEDNITYYAIFEEDVVSNTCYIPVPYFENFDNITTDTRQRTYVHPVCWTTVEEYEDVPAISRHVQLFNGSLSSHSKRYSLFMNYRGLYAMPELESGHDIRDLRMEFYLRQKYGEHQLVVGVLEDLNDPSSFVPVKTVNNASTLVEFVVVDFSSYSGQGRYIAFKNILADGAIDTVSYNYFDDIHIFNVSDCSVELADFPYEENFDGITTSTAYLTGVTPECWMLVDENASMPESTCPQVFHKSQCAHSGDYSLVMMSRGIYTMPRMSSGINVNNLKMELYVRQTSAEYQLQVGVLSDLNDPNTFDVVATIDNQSLQVEWNMVDFSTYNGDGKYIAFRNVLADGSEGLSYNYIDDITLSYTDGCVMELTDFPYVEDFEDVTVLTTSATGVEPECWILANRDVSMTDVTRPQIYYKRQNAHSGNYSLAMLRRGIYAMPKLGEDVNAKDLQMELYVRQTSAESQLQVGVMNNLNDPNTFEIIATIDNQGMQVEWNVVDFSTYEGSGKYIAFRNVLADDGTGSMSYNFIDDITLSYSSGCSIELADLPYVEDFENVTALTTAATGVEPECWTLANKDVPMTGTNRPQVYHKRQNAHSGNYSLSMLSRGIYAMPKLGEGLDVKDLRMELYVRQTSAASQLQVGVMSDLGDPGSFEVVATIDNQSQQVEYSEVDFSTYEGSGKYIAFRNVLADNGTGTISYNFIDDITLSIATPETRLAENEQVSEEVETVEETEETASYDNEGNFSLLTREPEVTVYPNPTMGNLHFAAMENVEKVEVFNNIGRLMATFNNQREINISDMPAGLYMLRVTLQGDAVVMKKVVKK